MKKQKEQLVENPLRAIPSEEEVLNEIPFSEEEETERQHHDYLSQASDQSLQRHRKKKLSNNNIKQFIEQCSHEQLMQAFPEGGTTSIIQELIATGEATFDLIWYSEMDMDFKNAFWQLRKQFEMYSKLLLIKHCRS